MSATRPKKRGRPTNNSYHDNVLLDDKYDHIYAREGKLRRVGDGFRPTHTQRNTLVDDVTWNGLTAWGPPDDTDYALDSNSELYDNLVEADVMQDDSTDAPAPKPKKKRSRVSKRPHVVWMELHRQSYLEEMLRWEGRADASTSSECPDCIARSVKAPLAAEYRCQECFLPDLVCASCCVKRHKMNPFHRIEKWSGSSFENVSLKSIGLKVQLNHMGLFCENPIPCHKSMLVLHTNGIHEVAIQFCGCHRAIPQHLQLLRRRLYPSSQLNVKNCVTFELLRQLHHLALATKASTYDFYRSLEKSTTNLSVDAPKSRYRALLRTVLQWRHLKLLKRAGRGNDPTGVAGTQNGELAIRCPSCPWPGVNLAEDWKNAPESMKFLYMVFLCMDANFRLKNQLVSNYSQDPGLGIGWAYMVPRKPYEKYVLSQANNDDISTCVGFQALAKANNKFSVGLRYTGTNAVVCGRSEMIFPLGVGNLHKGERYSNMDYIFGSVLQLIFVLLVLVSYDVACQWFVNLDARMQRDWPSELKVDRPMQLIPAIPKLHYSMHEAAGHEVYSLNFLPGAGMSDCECPERVWAPHNALGNSTKTQAPGSRHDVLDDHFGFWNWSKYTGMGSTLLRRYKAAIAERNIQTEGHRGFTQVLRNSVVQCWEAMCLEWEEDRSFPKVKKNPYHISDEHISEAQVKKQLAAEEEQRLKAGGVSLNSTSPSSFIAIGLEIEESQRRLKRVAQGVISHLATTKEGNLTEQRNVLRTKIRVWDRLVPIYMPGLTQYLELSKDSQPTSDTTPSPTSLPNPPESKSHHPEDVDIWLPSRICASQREAVCIEGLPGIEERLRTGQCKDSLEGLRQILRLKSRMVQFKNKNIRGQRDGTRSRAVIDRVHERARAAAAKYRAARQSLYNLRGKGDWEATFQVLDDRDIRSYQDPDRLRPRQGRQGIWEDDEVPVDPGPPSSELTLFNETRTKRDGTGETRRTISWIWMNVRVKDTKDEDDEILRAEWAKSRARAARAKEEVMLLKEEMSRVLKYLDWKANWWRKWSLERPDVSRELSEGMRAYALTQAAVQDTLAKHFKAMWDAPLCAPDDVTSKDKGYEDGSSDSETEAEILESEQCVREGSDDEDM
ncbi:hypothetical protein CVT26_013324 [Gymnopilus dilepis]|uniref:CxC2-like cysteine cluster KDZ transposase-associated domain-containing protein n=1 Tax=Gymnopilus dilepis TaxID=231916 RepID=A0A409YF48_9AGAR|nr:hypothetical protein CVT26_013324 [Gymnopilus dilepis]